MNLTPPIKWKNRYLSLVDVPDSIIEQIQADALRAVLGIGGDSDMSPAIKRKITEKANQLHPIREEPKP